MNILRRISEWAAEVLDLMFPIFALMMVLALVFLAVLGCIWLAVMP